jgi:restriction endonuclease S subunit
MDGIARSKWMKICNVKEILNEHDIAIVRYGASAGFVCTGLKGQIANNLFKVELETKEFDSDYLLCFLQSPMFSNFIASKVTGAAMPALSFSMFNDFDISYPSSRDKQLSLISKFHLVDRQIENLISFHEKKLLNLKQLKETILAQELQSEAA